jgi:hypothetical protein
MKGFPPPLLPPFTSFTSLRLSKTSRISTSDSRERDPNLIVCDPRPFGYRRERGGRRMASSGKGKKRRKNSLALSPSPSPSPSLAPSQRRIERHRNRSTHRLKGFQWDVEMGDGEMGKCDLTGKPEPKPKSQTRLPPKRRPISSHPRSNK